MENLYIHPTEKTPAIEFNLNGELKIAGKSIPENVLSFYGNIISWLQDFEKKRPEILNMHVDLEYFNSSSSKIILSIFKLLENMRGSGTNVNVYWYHDTEDEDIIEAGEGYKSMIKLPFHLVLQAA